MYLFILYILENKIFTITTTTSSSTSITTSTTTTTELVTPGTPLPILYTM